MKKCSSVSELSTAIIVKDAVLDMRNIAICKTFLRILTLTCRINTCIGASNLPLYWLHIVLDFTSAFIPFVYLITNFLD